MLENVHEIFNFTHFIGSQILIKFKIWNWVELTLANKKPQKKHEVP